MSGATAAKISLHSTLADGVLSVHARAPAGCDYAFYIYRDDERIGTRDYGAGNAVHWDTQLRPGSYRAKVFARSGQGKPLSRYSQPHTVQATTLTLGREGGILLIGTRNPPGHAQAELRLYRNAALVEAWPLPGDTGASSRRVPAPQGEQGGIYHCEIGLRDQPALVRSRNLILMPADALAPEDLDAWPAQPGPLRLRGPRHVFPALFQPGAPQRLYVLLTGAVDRKRIALPKFARWSWAERFPGHVLALDDPTLELDDALELGWFMGRRDADATAELADIIAAFAERLGVAPGGIVFYGSSGGGFAALALAHRLQGSVAVAINPQVDATRFFSRQRDDLLRVAFGGLSPEQAAATLRERFCMQHAWQGETHSRAIVVQNRQDLHHYTKHYPLLAQALGLPAQTGYSRDWRHFSLLYSDPAGHGPEPQDLVATIISLSERFSAPQESDTADPALQRADFQVFEGGGAQLPAEGFKPRPDVPPVTLAVPLDWTMDPFGDRNWRFHLQAWRFLTPAWKAYFDRDWSQLQAVVLPFVLDWHRYHVTEGRASTFAWYDMAVGLRAQHLAMLLWLQQSGKLRMAPDTFEVVLSLARLHAAKLNAPGFISAGNHGIFQLQGLRLLELTLAHHPGPQDLPARAQPQLHAMLRSQFDPHGIHTENSPAYHLFIMRTFRKIRLALFPAMAEAHPTLLGMAAEAAPWFTLPDGGLACIGDSSGPGVPFPATARLDQTASAADGTPLIHRDMTASGYAVVRSAPGVPAERASMLIVHGTGQSQAHAHADQLGFDLYACGRRLFIDAGKYAYSHDAWRDHFVSDVAHNTVGLHDRVFMPQDTRLQGSALREMHVSEDGRCFIIKGRVCRGGDFTHVRRFVYRPGISLTLEEAVEKPAASLAVSRYLLAPDVEAVRTGNAEVSLRHEGRTVAVLRAGVPDAEIAIVRGEESPARGWFSPSYLRREPTTAIIWTYPAQVTRYTMEILLSPDPP